MNPHVLDCTFLPLSQCPRKVIQTFVFKDDQVAVLVSSYGFAWRGMECAARILGMAHIKLSMGKGVSGEQILLFCNDRDMDIDLVGLFQIKSIKQDTVWPKSHEFK